MYAFHSILTNRTDKKGGVVTPPSFIVNPQLSFPVMLAVPWLSDYC